MSMRKSLLAMALVAGLAAVSACAEEVEDFVAAANMMLESYGTEEIKMPFSKTSLERIKLNAQNAKAQGEQR